MSDPLLPPTESCLLSAPWPGQQARQRDTLDIEALYQQWGDEIWAYIRSMIGNDSDADDVFQLVFLKAHRGLDRFQGSARAARSWLFTISINAVRDHCRRRSFQALDSIAEPGQSNQDPSQDVQHAELSARLQQAVAALSPKLREVWVLRAERELSFQAIADLLNEPRKRIMGRMYLALEQIRRAVGQEAEG